MSKKGWERFWNDFLLNIPYKYYTYCLLLIPLLLLVLLVVHFRGSGEISGVQLIEAARGVLKVSLESGGCFGFLESAHFFVVVFSSSLFSHRVPGRYHATRSEQSVAVHLHLLVSVLLGRISSWSPWHGVILGKRGVIS